MKFKINLDIKKLSLFLVVFNTLVMFKDLPSSIIMSTLGIIILSFIVTNKQLRVIGKVLILGLIIFLLKLTFKTYLVTEAGVSLVMLLSALKLWEMENENDHFNMFLILALLECCLFLLNPTFIAFFFGILKILIFFYFILKIRNYDLTLLNGKRLLYLMAPSLLLSMVLFYTFPRFTQGFISSTNPQLLFSGADSQLTFKNLGPLNPSTKVVFRVYGLNSEKLAIPLLYWRQSVLWDYFKGEWRTGYQNLKSIPLKSSGPTVNYKVQLVQDYNEFLPILDGTTQLTLSNLDFNYYTEESFRLRNISRTTVLYEATTNLQEVSKTFTSLMERKSLRLKSDQKERIKNLILGNSKKFIDVSDKQKLDLVINFFKNRNFEYTLTPPTYSSVEDFIINGKEGYCSHFAAAFAFMARSIDLPSRIVSGYQGGEYNPFDQSLIVRELDGHAWVEVFIKDTGWLRYDPTAIVAPGRIQMGASSFNDKLEPFINLFYYQLPKSFFKFNGFNNFSLWLDSLNSVFNTNILNFDKDKQQQVLNSFLPKSISLGTLFTIALIGSMPLFWFLFSWLSSKDINPAERRYKKFVKTMRAHGIEKLNHESASAFRKRCLDHNADLSDLIDTETQHYIKSSYERASLN